MASVAWHPCSLACNALNVIAKRRLAALWQSPGRDTACIKKLCKNLQSFYIYFDGNHISFAFGGRASFLDGFTLANAEVS